MNKENTPVHHVSDTAFWIAEYRALESERADALFKDPLAKVLAQGRGEEITLGMKNRAAMSWSVALRTKIIDDFILESIAEGVDAVLNLGAGLDTRPYRLNLSPTFQWFEADFPALINFKTEKLKEHQPLCQLERRALDVTSSVERQKLLEEINQRAQKVLVLTEGVVIYLKEDEVASLAKALAATPHFNYWIVDYFSPYFKKVQQRSPMAKLLRNAPFLFWPENWTEFFKNNGWLVQEMRYLADQSERLNRPLPKPWPMKLLSPFLSKKILSEVRHMFGYALLKKHQAHS